jgi:hypothetical protein
MADIGGEDPPGVSFEDVVLEGASFSEVRLTNARMRRVRFLGGEVRGALVTDVRMIGVEMQNVDISGDFENVTFNGVEIGPLVEAELNRREPERAKIRPDDVEGFREAWSIVRRRWDETIERAKELPPESLHVSVNGEWSLIQTLRHLSFASAAWIDRMILGDPLPFDPLDLPWDEAPEWEEIPVDREARPDLDTVLAIRRNRQATVDRVLADLTPEQLAANVTRTEPGWPQMEDFPVKHCLSIVINEEWEHRNFAERDLAQLA